MIDFLSVLVAILIVNLTVLMFVWNIYGQRIQALICRKDEKDIILGLFLLSLLIKHS